MANCTLSTRKEKLMKRKPQKMLRSILTTPTNIHLHAKTRVVTLSDWHYPFVDERAIAVAFQWCKQEQPEIIIVHECHDFYDLSKYDKDPARIGKLQEELDGVFEHLKQLRGFCPHSRIILLNSNHLERMRKYLWFQAPALSGLKALNIEQLLRLKELNIEFRDFLVFKKVMFKHGSIVRKFAGYTAKGEFEKEGMSGCSGHTHRLATYYTRLRGGFYIWVESGCLCLLDPEYIDGIANWTQGFSVFSFDKDGDHFSAVAIPIIDGRCDYGSKTYEAR